MNILTRGGVCKELELSPYTFTYMHNETPVYLHFSSKLHLDKFTKNRSFNYSMIYNSIYKRFKFKIDCILLADFNLYYKIENRGCYIKIGDTVYRDLKKIIIK